MTKNFTWRKVSEEEKEETKKESKKLLNTFASKIEKIKIPVKHFQEGSGTREEGNGWQTDAEFKEIMLENAPFVEEETIVAEKGAWK